MKIGIWLACGTLASAVAWSARAQSYPGGPLSAVAAGVSGGFLGGALVTLIAGSKGLLSSLSVYGAIVGAIIVLDLAERTSGSLAGAPRTSTIAWLWSWALLLDPLLLALMVAATVGARVASVLIGTLAGLLIILAMYWQRNHGALLVRTWRRHS
jgi:uncharacterized membrane protein YeaQ/YmgE (transglycosylase-associated protein family)